MFVSTSRGAQYTVLCVSVCVCVCVCVCTCVLTWARRLPVAAGDTFVANDEALYEHKLVDAGSELGCASRVQDGVTPNQYGTWNFGRAGWCPGGAVAPWVVDVTKGLRPGMKAMIGCAYTSVFPLPLSFWPTGAPCPLFGWWGLSLCVCVCVCVCVCLCVCGS